jgi:hypothetical protein
MKLGFIHSAYGHLRSTERLLNKEKEERVSVTKEDMIQIICFLQHFTKVYTSSTFLSIFTI